MSDYRLRDAAKDGIRGTTLAIIVGVCAVVVLIVVGLVGVYGFGWFQRGTADFRGRTNQINQVNGNGSYRIAAYDHFYDLCAGVQTDEARIASTQRDLKLTTDPARKMQLEANLSAQQNTRAGDINQYNADARKAATEGQFRASDLPYQLDINAEETTCTAQ